MAGGDYSIDEPVRFAVNPLAGSAVRINVGVAENIIRRQLSKQTSLKDTT